MPSVVPNPHAIRPFSNEAAFEAWLAKHHDRAEEIWIKIYKKGSGKPSIDASQAIDVCLCWGWIDGIRKSFDAEAFLQRYTPRRAKSRWSQINVERVAQLVKAGRMTPYGQAQIDAAKADGRWGDAYPSPRAIQVPEDFLKAVAKNRKALAAFGALNRTSTHSIAYRLHHLKTPEGRAKLIASLVEKLASAEAAEPPRLAAKVGKKAPAAKKGRGKAI